VYGDEQPYALAPPKEGTTSYSCIALRPFKWPGALTVFQVCSLLTVRMVFGNLFILVMVFHEEVSLMSL